MPNSLVHNVIESHGGHNAWSRIERLLVRLRVGGNIIASKFKSPRTRHLEVQIDTCRIRAQLSPFPAKGLRGIFEEDSVRIETSENAVVKQRAFARDADARVERHLIWDDLDLLYFLGYAVWNYAMTPYYFLWPGFDCEEGEMWRERDGSSWRSLRVSYPPAFPTHSRIQTFYFDDRCWLRRLDYTAHVFGEWTRGAHYCLDHRIFDGLVFPTHRVVYPRFSSGHPFKLFTAMEGWIDDAKIIVP